MASSALPVNPESVVHLDTNNGAHRFPCTRAALAARSHAQGITTQNNFLEQSLIIIVTIITLLPFSVIYLLL